MNIKNKIASLVLFSLVLFGGNALASSPKDFGLQEGNLIRATGDNDIFIVNEYGYKRLFLNPAIFNMYGHLGGWENVKTVSPATRDAFKTSPYFRANGDTKVYKLEATGDDTGTLRWVNMSQSDFLSIADVNQIFTINDTELNWYPKGSDIVSETSVNVAALSKTNLASQTIPAGAKNVRVLSVDFKGNGAVDKLTINRLGFLGASQYDKIYLTINGRRITEPATFSGVDNKVVVFNNLGLTAPFTADVVVDFLGSEPSGTPARVEMSGEYSGLPLQGNQFVFAQVSPVSSFNIGDSVSVDPVVVGQKNAKVGEFKVSVPSNVESVTLKSVQIRNLGNADISNLKFVVDGISYSASALGDEKFLVNTDVSITNGKTKKVEVFADVSDNSDGGDTVALRIEKSYDVVTVGNVFGFGVSVAGLPFDLATVSVNESGSLTASAVSGDKVVALWGDTGKTLFQFKLKAEDESFTLNEMSFNLDEDSVKKVYVYQGSTLVGSETLDGNVATISANYVLSGEKTFTVKADFNLLDTSVSEDFVPSLVTVKAVGVGSDEEVSSDSVSGNVVYVYSAYPVITRTDSFSSNLPPTWTNVLEFSVKAVGGDLKLASTSAAFKFEINAYGMPDTAMPYKVYVDGVQYANGNWASTSANFEPLLSDEGDEVIIAEGSSKTVLVKFDFAGSDSERGFQITLNDTAGSVNWLSQDSDDNWLDMSSVEDTLSLPVESTQFYRESL